jgi:hypothetical protein
MAVFGAVQVLVQVGTGPAGRLLHGDGVEVDATLQEGELLSRYEHELGGFDIISSPPHLTRPASSLSDGRRAGVSLVAHGNAVADTSSIIRMCRADPSRDDASEAE